MGYLFRPLSSPVNTSLKSPVWGIARAIRLHDVAGARLAASKTADTAFPETTEQRDMATPTEAAPVASASVKKAPKQLPPPNSDFYQLVDVLTAEESATVKKVRAYLESKSAPSSTNIGPTTPFRSSSCHLSRSYSSAAWAIRATGVLAAASRRHYRRQGHPL
jgi:hypothetical protein